MGLAMAGHPKAQMEIHTTYAAITICRDRDRLLERKEQRKEEKKLVVKRKL